MKENKCELFTDGSEVRGANCVGSACYCPQLDIRVAKSVNSHASVYTVEYIALEEAMEMANQIPKKDVYICSDSLNALTDLNYPQISVKVNPYILQIKKNMPSS